MSLLVICEFNARNDGEPEFLRVARALASAAANEPGTLRYQWFATQRPGHFSIVEEYVDAEAAQTHDANVDSMLRELFAVADLVSVSFYGELNQYLREWSSGREGVAVNRAL